MKVSRGSVPAPSSCTKAWSCPLSHSAPARWRRSSKSPRGAAVAMRAIVGVLGATHGTPRRYNARVAMQVVVKPSEQAAEVSVSEVNRRVRGRIEGAPDLRGLWIRGEISNVRLGGTGHLYFTLKDD